MNETIKVIVDRPIGFSHHGTIYPINYGYVTEVIGGDGEEQDAYILDEVNPIEEYTGKLIAIIHRADDCETKWVVANKMHTKEDIIKQTYFIEQYFDSTIEMIGEK